MSGYRELMRRKLLEDIYNKMSPEEKRTFIQLTLAYVVVKCTQR